MSRSLSAGFLAEINALQSRPGHLLTVVFDDETVRACDLFTGVRYAGNDYPALGDLLGFDNLSETLEDQVPAVRVSLSGVTQQWSARVLGKPFRGRRITLLAAMFDTAWQVVVNPVPKLDGIMNNVSLRSDPDRGSSVLVIEATNGSQPPGQRSGRHCNHDEQQLWFAGDGLFKHSQDATRPLMWGAKL